MTLNYVDLRRTYTRWTQDGPKWLQFCPPLRFCPLLPRYFVTEKKIHYNSISCIGFKLLPKLDIKKKITNHNKTYRVRTVISIFL